MLSVGFSQGFETRPGYILCFFQLLCFSIPDTSIHCLPATAMVSSDHLFDFNTDRETIYTILRFHELCVFTYKNLKYLTSGWIIYYYCVVVNIKSTWPSIRVTVPWPRTQFNTSFPIHTRTYLFLIDINQRSTSVKHNNILNIIIWKNYRLKYTHICVMSALELV